MKYITLILLTTLLQGMELEIGYMGSNTVAKKVAITNDEALGIIERFKSLEIKENFSERWGTGGNSGGNTPPPIILNIFDNNGKILYRIYGEFDSIVYDNNRYSIISESDRITLKARLLP